MLNRRYLRIKILQSLYAYYQAGDNQFHKHEKDLFQSIDKIQQLYLLLILTLPELKTIAREALEKKKTKILPSKEDLEPNTKWINNLYIQKIEESKMLRQLSEKLKINWIGVENKELLIKVFKEIKDTETYFEFMHNDNIGFEEDKSFMIALFKNEIANSQYLHHFFEEKNIHWMDDLDHACSMILKTFKAINEKDDFVVLPLYKNENEEKEFVSTLFKKTIENDLKAEALIEKLTQNWELERIAKLDVILLKMGICELLEFPEIPTKVTLNEIIEIAKFYSTPKSSNFINGILDKAIEELNINQMLSKSGRGLT
ncbi:MAG: transcription antitermination factor NusB [Crocinitomicaceae bacterium]|nr:transcription antitermination factor NusB [Crocinitomicaceae bacterium]